MTRPSRIPPSLLRDQDDPARVERVWRRLERRLVLADGATSPARVGGRSRVVLGAVAAAALAAAFAGGIFVGRGWEPPAPGLQASDTIQGDDREGAVPAVLVAGTQPHAYPLPGGSRIKLSPASIVEPVAHGTGGFAMRLVRGEVVVNSAAGGDATRLSVLVGGASVSTDGGSFRLRADGDMADVEVLEGMAEVATPDAELGLRLDLLRENERRRIAVRVLTARLEPTPPSPPQSPSVHVAVREPAPDETAEPTAPPPPPGPDWHQHCLEGDWEVVVKYVRDRHGTESAAVTSASSSADLACYGWALRASEPAAAELALKRLVAEYPNDPNAFTAAYSLATMYRKAGNAERAAFYYQEAQRLSPKGDLAEDALCNRIEAEERAGNKDEAARLAREYLAGHPQGECRTKVERLLQRLASPEQPSGSADAATSIYDEGPEPTPGTSGAPPGSPPPSSTAGGAAPAPPATASAHPGP